MFDVRLGSHVYLAAGGQLASPLPILACSLVVALHAADVAALQQCRRGIRRSCYCLLDIGQRGVEPIEGAVCRASFMQRSYIAASAAASRGEAVCTGGSAAAALPHTMIKRTHKPRIVKGLRLREVLAVLGQAQYVRRICEDWKYFFAPPSNS